VGHEAKTVTKKGKRKKGSQRMKYHKNIRLKTRRGGDGYIYLIIGRDRLLQIGGRGGVQSVSEGGGRGGNILRGTVSPNTHLE